eukprot:TRINITY_DN30129_c0_g1_i1.p1 TRINITY_DN30129_c0_g1~~TRINITY_DN30129_c0_g1_i1.p1  ORF type:complete len:621 (+),score=82.28 TRINITY_DN30129_c0_g1_i1:65-1927(+)
MSEYERTPVSWQNLGTDYVKEFKIHGVGTDHRIYVCDFAHSSSWKLASKGSIKDIAISGMFVYGVGMNDCVYRQYLYSMDSNSPWTRMSSPGVTKICLWEGGQTSTSTGGSIIYGLSPDGKIHKQDTKAMNTSSEWTPCSPSGPWHDIAVTSSFPEPSMIYALDAEGYIYKLAINNLGKEENWSKLKKGGDVKAFTIYGCDENEPEVFVVRDGGKVFRCDLWGVENSKYSEWFELTTPNMLSVAISALETRIPLTRYIQMKDVTPVGDHSFRVLRDCPYHRQKREDIFDMSRGAAAGSIVRSFDHDSDWLTVHLEKIFVFEHTENWRDVLPEKFEEFGLKPEDAISVLDADQFGVLNIWKDGKPEIRPAFKHDEQERILEGTPVKDLDDKDHFGKSIWPLTIEKVATSEIQMFSMSHNCNTRRTLCFPLVPLKWHTSEWGVDDSWWEDGGDFDFSKLEGYFNRQNQVRGPFLRGNMWHEKFLREADLTILTKRTTWHTWDEISENPFIVSDILKDEGNYPVLFFGRVDSGAHMGLVKVFEKFDLNGDNFLDFCEIQKLFVAINPGTFGELDEGSWSKVFEKCDSNRDGRVTCQEMIDVLLASQQADTALAHLGLAAASKT